VLSWPNYDGASPEAVIPAGLADGPARYWGDLALAGETVIREATAEKKAFAAHFSHLIIHGVLHLLGHDHIEDDQAERMEALETLALNSLGYPDPYGDHEDAA
jgi:probable rRNA maturation factor